MKTFLFCNSKKRDIILIANVRFIFLIFIMKKVFLISLIVISISTASVSFAHPWRTDSSWCHTCRTNCASRWLSNWQYHCHSSNTQTNVTSTKNTTIWTAYWITVSKDSLCNTKFPWTIYRASDDKCVCANWSEWDSLRRHCPIATNYNQQIATSNSSLKNTQCEIKYPWTIYRASDDKCVCQNWKEWNITTKSCETEYDINTEKCNSKYPWTVYRESDDQCICPWNNPYGWNSNAKSCD